MPSSSRNPSTRASGEHRIATEGGIELALPGFAKVTLEDLSRMMTCRTEPHAKLH
jgi:hypothetical protein